MKTVNKILRSVNDYEDKCHEITKYAKIRKLPNGKYRVLSEKGKNLGTLDTKEKAVKRLRQVEYFKDHNKSDDKVIDLTKADDFSYSALMRQMRQKASATQLKTFMIIFKNEFDNAIKNDFQKPDKVALQNTVIKFNKIHKIKLSKTLVKNASISELGSPILVGKYLANIVKFILTRIKPENRMKAINNLKHKFYILNTNEIANKKLPASSAIGQSITFVKHVLFNHDANYIREVINNLIRNL